MPPLRAELLMIGTELLLGQIQDTNAGYMAEQLADHGINLYQKTTVGDNPERIRGALDAALSRSEVVLCSGGLGPTEDDITRDCIADLLDRPLAYHDDLFEDIRARFMHSGRKITENNKKQAFLPEGAEAIPNPHGTAPGVFLDDPRGIIICMPGVPSELKPMLRDEVIPRLRKRFGMQGVLRYRVLKVCGMGESRVDSEIGDLMREAGNPTIGLLASPDAVKIRIAAHAADAEAAEALIEPMAQAIASRLPGLIMGGEEDSLEGVVDQLLQARGWRLALAETLTGGRIAQRLVGVSATSFAGGVVLPVDYLGNAVADDTLIQRGIELNARILLDYTAEAALSVVSDVTTKTTVAVFQSPAGQKIWEIGHYGSLQRNQGRISTQALEQLRRFLLESA